MKKFNLIYEQVMQQLENQSKNIWFGNKVLTIGHLFAPVKPFHINQDMLVGQGFIFKGEDTYAGRVKNILSNDEIIYEVTGNYSKRMIPDINNLGKEIYIQAGYSAIRCKSFLIKYKLIPGEHYYICDKNNPPWETGEWLEVIF